MYTKDKSLVSAFHIALLCFVLTLLPSSHAQTVNWNGLGGNQRWETSSNWNINNQPTTSSFVRIDSFSGQTLRLGNGTLSTNFIANAGTLHITEDPSSLANIEAVQNSAAVSTINFGSNPAGLIYAHTAAVGSNNFQLFIGQNRARCSGYLLAAA